MSVSERSGGMSPTRKECLKAERTFEYNDCHRKRDLGVSWSSLWDSFRGSEGERPGITGWSNRHENAAISASLVS